MDDLQYRGGRRGASSAAASRSSRSCRISASWSWTTSAAGRWPIIWAPKWCRLERPRDFTPELLADHPGQRRAHVSVPAGRGCTTARCRWRWPTRSTRRRSDEMAYRHPQGNRSGGRRPGRDRTADQPLLRRGADRSVAEILKELGAGRRHRPRSGRSGGDGRHGRPGNWPTRRPSSDSSIWCFTRPCRTARATSISSRSKTNSSIRYRVDGALYEMAPPPKHLALPVISRIKVMANLNISERRLPQDGRISLQRRRPADRLARVHAADAVRRIGRVARAGPLGGEPGHRNPRLAQDGL